MLMLKILTTQFNYPVPAALSVVSHVSLHKAVRLLVDFKSTDNVCH